MNFVVEKDPGMIPSVLADILDNCVNGVTLSDPDLPDNPIVFANAVFERMTGYGQDEILGRNCRFLQGDDREQPGLQEIRAALAEQRPVEVTLRNYRKDGTRFYNRLSIRPLKDPDGRVIYYLGVQYDVTEQVAAQQEIARLTQLLGQG
ncbi:PAS domain-containing protein [Thiohalocapsa sp. ML1]|jgi:PAS domain S-box-containing protein|uniref:PAS domain-containing protein n=1 Tax=Thiohalocapsa sp. ML1 TaxID=1431688 RepID=UPI000731EF7B|nr:PAS domain-containing protein [Thiohalocapsa sp. ML1]